MLFFLGDGPPYTWQSSSLTSSLPNPFIQASEHDIWTFTGLACSRVNASRLCHLEYPKLLQMWHIVFLGMWAVSIYQQSLRFLLKLVASFFFLGRVDVPFDSLPFSFAAALKSQLVFFERLSRIGLAKK